MALRVFDGAFAKQEGDHCISRDLWLGWGMSEPFRRFAQTVLNRCVPTPQQQSAYDNLLTAFPENGSGAKFK
jgi:hypothetical protein